MHVKSSTYIKVKDLTLPQKRKYYKVNEDFAWGRRKGGEDDKREKRNCDKIVERETLFYLRIDDRNVVSQSVNSIMCFQLSTKKIYEKFKKNTVKNLKTIKKRIKDRN